SKVRQSDDGFDVIFEFDAPVKDPQKLLTVPLLPSGLHGPLNDPDHQRPLPHGVLGAGPYVPAGANKLNVLTVFKDAVRKPKISEIRIMTAGSRGMAMELVRLMANAVTFDSNPVDATLLNQEFGIHMLKMPGQRLLVLAYNPSDSLLGKKRFREAVLAGIDRNEFFIPGEPGRPSLAPVSTNHAHYPRDLKAPTRDSIEARRILWWSDWERDSDQIYFLKEGALSDKEPAAIRLLVDGDSAVDLRRAAIFKQRMLEAAISVTLDVRPRFEFLGRIRSQTYSTSLVSLEMPQDGNLRSLFHSKGGLNVVGFSDAEVDKALEIGDVDAAIRGIVAKAPMIFLGLQRKVGAAGKKVKGSALIGRGGLGRIEKWQIR
ncbi:MAG TPA: hypothetical protein EYN06_06390, partial [Myxococcales bacterium]|nr:hypothetical protein [Myxococcales bacterium]